MIKTLIKKQLLEVFQSYFVNKKTGKARGKSGTALFLALLCVLFVLLGFAVYTLTGDLGKLILGTGNNWIFFAMTGLLSAALGVFGSVFNTYAGMYMPKDNEFLMALPIKPFALLLARMSGVFVTSFMYSALVWIPSMIAYFTIVPLRAANVIIPILMTFVVALFVTVLSCILGFFVALIAKKTKGKSILTVIFSLAFLALYYVVYFKVINSLKEIAAHIGEIGNAVKTWLHYVYLLGRASDGDILSAVEVSTITAALLVICVYILSKTFMKLASGPEGVKTEKRAKDDFSQKSPGRAMLSREYKHFLSVSTWMLNGGFGLLVLPILAVLAIVKSDALQSVLGVIGSHLPEFVPAVPFFLTAAICFIISTSALSSVSVSIEGKSMWIIQSLPVSPFEILRAKERMSVRIGTVPSLVAVITLGIVLRLEAWEVIMAAFAVFVYVWLNTDFGLYLNLKKPQFNWSNAAALTKQSTPVVINLFGGWAFCIGIAVGGFFLSRVINGTIVLALFITLLLSVEIILHRYLKTKGAEIIAHIS